MQYLSPLIRGIRPLARWRAKARCGFRFQHCVVYTYTDIELSLVTRVLWSRKRSPKKKHKKKYKKKNEKEKKPNWFPDSSSQRSSDSYTWPELTPSFFPDLKVGGWMDGRVEAGWTNMWWSLLTAADPDVECHLFFLRSSRTLRERERWRVSLDWCIQWELLIHQV